MGAQARSVHKRIAVYKQGWVHHHSRVSTRARCLQTGVGPRTLSQATQQNLAAFFDVLEQTCAGQQSVRWPVERTQTKRGDKFYFEWW
jgi:hypothetical protein